MPKPTPKKKGRKSGGGDEVRFTFCSSSRPQMTDGSAPSAAGQEEGSQVDLEIPTGSPFSRVGCRHPSHRSPVFLPSCAHAASRPLRKDRKRPWTLMHSTLHVKERDDAPHVQRDDEVVVLRRSGFEQRRHRDSEYVARQLYRVSKRGGQSPPRCKAWKGGASDLRRNSRRRRSGATATRRSRRTRQRRESLRPSWSCRASAFDPRACRRWRPTVGGADPRQRLERPGLRA